MTRSLFRFAALALCAGLLFTGCTPAAPPAPSAPASSAAAESDAPAPTTIPLPDPLPDPARGVPAPCGDDLIQPRFFHIVPSACDFFCSILS